MLTKEEFEVLVFYEDQRFSTDLKELKKRTGFSSETITSAAASLTDKGLLCHEKVTEKGLRALEPYRVQRAIFLAAGFGSRLVPITLNTPKPLVRVHGTRMIDSLLDAVEAVGIKDIVIVTGYLKEEFEQLRYKYPDVRFVNNPVYNRFNNISSAMYVKDLFCRSYVLEADLVLSNPRLIRKYEYESNYLGIPVKQSGEWCFATDKNGYFTDHLVGGRDCYQMVGISYWTDAEGRQLEKDLQTVYDAPGGKDKFWDEVPQVEKKSNYRIWIRPCFHEDIVEIDSFSELQEIDPEYRVR